MWKATVGHQQILQNNTNDGGGDEDDWETDPDFVNDVTEQEQRWGSKTIAGSGRTAGAINMEQLRLETEQSDALKKKQLLVEQNAGFGYGGKFGIEHDRMDKSAVGHDYVGKVEKHASQKDYADGFGGKFGVQTDRVDKSAVSWEHKESMAKHSSQKDYAEGFGGKFGIQQDRVDKSAVGWDHIEKVEKHESQKDYSKGFGGKFGVQEDRKDKSAVGWDYVEAPQKHESQIDHKVGFGGKFGVQSDRMDKSALGFQENADKIGTNYTKTKPDIGSAKPSNLRAKFENLAKINQQEDEQRAMEQKKAREEKDRYDREQAAKRTIIEGNESTGGKSNNKNQSQRREQHIETGRQGGINSAINQFNNQTTTTTSLASVSIPPQKKLQFPLEKEAKDIHRDLSTIQPDVIPITTAAAAAVATVAINESLDATKDVVEKQDEAEKEEQLYANVVARPTSVDVDVTTIGFSDTTSGHDGLMEPIYQNQEDLAEYIEDTGLKAIALYDYQAAADDEISFDPDDVITHIEMIDEGWWRGLCKNRYGLFPANYVQLQK